MKNMKNLDYDGVKVDLIKGQYLNGRVSLSLVSSEERFPFAMCTVNLPDEPVEADEVAIKDYSENEGMLQFLFDNGIVDQPLRIVRSGYVQIPICKCKLIF